VNIKLTKLSRPPPKRSTEGGEKTLVAAGTGIVAALTSMFSRSPMRESRAGITAGWSAVTTVAVSSPASWEPALEYVSITNSFMYSIHMVKYIKYNNMAEMNK